MKSSATIFLSSMIFMSNAYCYSPVDERVADKMLSCSAVYGWIYKKSKDPKKVKLAEARLSMFTGVAKDVTSEKYVNDNIVKHLLSFKKKVEDDPLNMHTIIQREYERCEKFEGLDQDMINRLRGLVEIKKK